MSATSTQELNIKTTDEDFLPLEGTDYAEFYVGNAGAGIFAPFLFLGLYVGRYYKSCQRHYAKEKRSSPHIELLLRENMTGAYSTTELSQLPVIVGGYSERFVRHSI